ncbi:MAG: hypothetical protein J6P01_01945, partial [Prevotella sp.]|nr:hypothetical protein [Prevotella sp.]
IATCIFSLEKQLQRYTFFLKQQKKYRVFRPVVKTLILIFPETAKIIPLHQPGCKGNRFDISHHPAIE